ncbi:MAG TPA: NAD-dependent epimerase/dehydratase family protein [Candidatus Dormibacteraeota bacterium]
MARDRRILVTGVARWWGALTVQRLQDDPRVAEVIGIDTEEPRYDLGRADFLDLDIRHSLIGKLVRAVGIDTVVHTSTTIDSFDLNRQRAHETNVIGTLNLLAGCAGSDSPVRRVVLKSSGHVYGCRYNLPSFVTEDRRLDVNSPHAFVRDMVEVEAMLADFGVRNPEITPLVLRFSNALNAEEPQPFARYLDLPVVPTVLGYEPIMQLIHRDDCVRALCLAALDGPAGTYNIATPDPAPLTRILDASGKPHAPLLPPVGLGGTALVLRSMGLAFLSPQLLDLLRWGRSLNVTRASQLLGFDAERGTFAAFEEFVEQRRVLPYMPEVHTYLYERELEEFIRSRQALSVLDPSPALPAERGGEDSPALPDDRGGGSSPPLPHRRRSPAPGR